MPTDDIPEETRNQLGKMSLLSPQVSRILDDLDDDNSDSGSEEGSASDKAGKSTHLQQNSKSPDTWQTKQENKPVKPSSLSPVISRTKSSSSKHKSKSSKPKPKPPHMARFHSLRSMLFSANIEDKIKTATEEDIYQEETAATKWKEQHEKRQISRPKTPEKDAQGKSGVGSRIKMKLRRLTSKDVPTLGQIGEDEATQHFDDNASTASSSGQDDGQERSPKRKEEDERSINHSDVEDLVRWVSKRDAPSDGETRNRTGEEVESDRESIADSDVDELARWVSRRSDTKKFEMDGLSEVSTESDEEVAAVSSEDEDPDDLVRWVSHKEGPKAGPVRRKMQRGDLDWEEEHNYYDSDIPELSRWATRQDDTSGESGPGTPVLAARRFDDEDEPERGRSRSRSASPAIRQKNHLGNNDIDELVRWVSRKESKRDCPNPEIRDEVRESLSSNQHVEPEKGDLRTLRTDQATVQDIKQQEDEKKEQLGMTADEGSLSHSDLKEVPTHVRGLNSNAQQQSTSSAATSKDVVSPDANDAAAVHAIKKDEEQKKEQLGMSFDEGSLSQGGLQEVLTHVKTLGADK